PPVHRPRNHQTTPEPSSVRTGQYCCPISLGTHLTASCGTGWATHRSRIGSTGLLQRASVAPAPRPRPPHPARAKCFNQATAGALLMSDHPPLRYPTPSADMSPGVILALVAYGLFSCADALIKSTGGELSVFQVGFFTSLFGIVPAVLTKSRQERWSEG